MVKAFRNKGYPYTKLVGAVAVNTDRHEATVSFKIEPGRKCQFGSIAITGNGGYVREEIFSRALRFNEGEVYSEEKVDESLRNLFNLDVFKTISIDPESEQLGLTAIPIQLNVEPKKRRSVGLGLGYGSEDGPRVSGTWTYRNAFSWAGKLSLNAKRSDLIQTVEVDYLQPYAMDALSSLRYQAGYEREFLDSHTNRRWFTDLDLSQKFRQQWTWNFGYILEANDIEDLNLDDPEEQARFRENNDFPYFSCRIRASSRYPG